MNRLLAVVVSGWLAGGGPGTRVAGSEPSHPVNTFTNPIVSGFHPDPSVCRVGNDYYLVHSTFEYFPGVPVFHSKDLVHWRLIGHALTRKSQLDLEGRASSHGIFAPTIRHHRGVFYMITTHVGGGGNFYVTATNAAGPWSDPVWLDREGIDPSLFFDEDGTVYYTRQVGGERGWSGQQELNLQTETLEGELRELWRGTGGVWPEGPHLYAIRGRYYLMISEGGTSYDHRITIARSDSPWGPFEPNPDNPVLTHRHLPDHPFQALGHGDLVETPDGWWIVFLGFRPQGGPFHHLGRETFLAPVEWNADGWPVVHGGRPIPAVLRAPELPPHPWPAPPARLEFDQPRLGLEWIHVRNPRPGDYSLTHRRGHLRLTGSAVTLTDPGSPTFVGRRQTDLACHIATRLDFHPQADNEEAGLALRGNERNHCALGITLREGRRQVFLRRVLDGEEIEPIRVEAPPEGDLILSVQAQPLRYEFLWAEPGGHPHPLGTVRTRDLATETLTAQTHANFNFTGVVVGLYATGNGQANSAPADYDWFEYRSAQP